ncbi:MAG: HD domain-containing protein [Lachnospiraceae bacterium]|nr:HD domain-containing protein [Lachnospiraceae bacterium]
MSKWKSWQIVLFIALCVAMNIVGKIFAANQQLPIWADSFGTALCAYVAGPVCGALVGITGNLAYSYFNPLSAAYCVTSIAIGAIVGIATKRRWFDQLYGFMKAASLAVLTALVVSVPLNLIFAEGYTGNVWGDGVIQYLLKSNWPPFICYVSGQMAIEFADKVLTIAAVYVMILLRRFQKNQENDRNMTRGSAAVLLFLCLMGLISMPVRAAEGQNKEPIDYNDFVQSVYSNNNGLPCGETNDIAQTNDGVLWIGTYAGLYRYNGQEFRWVDNYESVRNVNCLYVDEEGRLWIGTNDNGLSIVIREKVANILDDNSGLTSNSVRCVVRSSDGFYYVGTTGKLQILEMNNGLQIAQTMEDINYVESLSADQNDHVAAVASEGDLYLIRGGKVLATLALPDEQEPYNCCAFAPDGRLMVGTSGNQIYVYDVSQDTFELRTCMTCLDLEGINSIRFLNEDTMFICSDKGVSYLGTDGYHHLNTNEFANSIENVLFDYQGNLWFTSSRLGLLRLAKSPFKDVYGAVGMEREVVNAIVPWQRCYYIGTDDGLDVVDKACRYEIENTLTGEMEGTRIRCMYVDDHNHLWICTYGRGLLEYSPTGENWAYNAETGSFGNRARLVMELSDGTMVASGDAGIVFIKDHKVTGTIDTKDGLINSMILTLTEQKDGTILAGSDGDGIAVIKDGKITDVLTKEDGLASEVILRTVPDPKSDGVFIVTSNSLSYLDEDGSIRVLDKFPYFNNYDIWVKDEDTLFVMSSAGIYVVERDELVEGGEIAWELLDARRGLGTSLTANSWNCSNGEGELYLPCDTGVYVIDVDKYNTDVRSYRMQLASVKMDGVSQPLPRTGAITVGQGVSRIELAPEILNYTIQEPNVGYLLEGYDTQWTIVPQNSLNNIIYVNLPAGSYTFRLAILDSGGDKILGERTFDLVKEGEFYEQRGFFTYMIGLLSLMLIWSTWLIVQRQINQQQIKINMANETVMAIANSVDAKDVRTSQHSMRVAEYSVLIAQEMRCFKWWERRKALSNLRKAAQMHDIGKIGVPDSVLNKVGRLTDEEYVKMKSHVTSGAEILKDFTLVEHVVDGTRYHHERYDGKGYPDGLKGEEIPLFGRIIAVADAFDAMTSNRVYRNCMDTDYVMNEMRNGRGTQFDPKVLDAFMRLCEKGVIDVEKIYAQKKVEIEQSEAAGQEELRRRVEEDKKIQEAQMKQGENGNPAESKKEDKEEDKPVGPAEDKKEESSPGDPGENKKEECKPEETVNDKNEEDGKGAKA